MISFMEVFLTLQKRRTENSRGAFYALQNRITGCILQFTMLNLTFAVSQYNSLERAYVNHVLERSICYNGICEPMCYLYKGEMTSANISEDT